MADPDPAAESPAPLPPGENRWAEEVRPRTPMAGQLQREIEIKQARKLKARREKNRSIWFGLGMFGLVGWSVTIPALIGIAIGYWIDHQYPSRYSWTLKLVLLGTALGCLNAWNWIQKESHPE